MASESSKRTLRRPWRDLIDRLARRTPRPGRRKPRGGSAELEPVEPDKPKPLSGGAAAALEFDD